LNVQNDIVGALTVAVIELELELELELEEPVVNAAALVDGFDIAVGGVDAEAFENR